MLYRTGHDLMSDPISENMYISFFYYIDFQFKKKQKKSSPIIAEEIQFVQYYFTDFYFSGISVCFLSIVK